MTIRPLILQPDSEPYGANRALLRTIEAMPRGAVEPIVVFPYKGAALKEYEDAGCRVFIEDLAVLRRSSANVKGLIALSRKRKKTAEKIADLAISEQADFIHTNSMTIITGQLAAKKALIPHVWQLREAPRERGIYAKVLGMMLKKADLVIAVSRAASLLGPTERVRIVYDGYDLPQQRVSRRPERQTRIGLNTDMLIGMVGRITPSKAPHMAVEALGKLAAEGDNVTRLVLAGTVYKGYEDYARDKILKRAQKLGVISRVHVMGWLDDPSPLYKQLDALVIATESGEGFPGAVLEALAHGVPVISAATGGVNELVLHEKTGLVCEPGSVDEIVKAIKRLRDDRELCSDLEQGAKRHAQRWSTHASAERMLSAWRSVVKKRTGERFTTAGKRR